MKRKSLVNPKISLMLFITVFVLYSLVYMTKNCYSAAMASIVSAEIMTKSQTGLIAAIFYLVYAPFQIIGGWAADKVAPERLILLGVFGAGVANLLIYFFAENYVAMLIIWSLNAVVQFGVWPSIFKIITTELCEHHREVAIFYINLSGTAGLLLSYLIAVFVGNWKYNFLISAVVLFSLTVAFFFIYYGVSQKMEIVEIPVPVQNKKRSSSPIPLILKSGVPIFCIAYVIQGMLNLGMKTIAPVMLMESYEKVNDSLANALNIILVLAAPVGTLFAGMPILRKKRESSIILAVFAASAPSVAIMYFVGKIHVAVIVASLTVLMALLAAQSIFFSKISKQFVAMDCVGIVSGIFNCMASLGITLANLCFTRISEHFGWRVTMICCLILLGVATVLTVVAAPIWNRFKEKHLKSII
ncbi:MAG: MFS transporter [Clostridia bacterium]|nr:MFS transporter [Clostridia bacterium]